MQNTTFTILYLILTLGYIIPCHAQETDSLAYELALLDAELDEIFANEADSLSLAALIDGLLNAESRYSELSFRIGYSSRVTSAGRDFGLDQQGLTPGVSFYHKSGVYGDLSGFWNSALDPQYNLSIATIGYLGKLNKRTTFGLSYDHSFYTKKDTLNTLTNSLSASSTVNFKYFYTGLDYTFSFGNETAHRIIWNLTGNISLKGFGPIRKVSILPSIALLFGNQNITQQYVNVDKIDQFTGLSDRELTRLARNQNLTFIETRALIFIKNKVKDGDLNEEELARVNNFFSTTETSETFDLLNYYLTLPVAFYTKRLSIYVSYNYNIPRNLSDDITYEPNGYFGFSLAYNLRLK